MSCHGCDDAHCSFTGGTADEVVGAEEDDEAVEVVEASHGESPVPAHVPAYAPLHISSNPCRPCVFG